MVKNTTGGTGAKSLARKHQSSGGRSELTLPSCELELVACVTKALGNGMLEVRTNDDVRLIAHIRNKFRGKQKRHNMIGVLSIVLIGLREWETPYKNCDILTIYDSNQVEQLKNIPSIKINHVVKLSLGTSYLGNSKSSSDDVIFTEDDDTDAVDLSRGKVKEEFKLDTVDEIDFDDI
jgi:initiation factor 1A